MRGWMGLAILALVTLAVGSCTPPPTSGPPDCTRLEPRANLRGCDLRFADFTHDPDEPLDLRGANLTDANLDGVDLEGLRPAVDLTGATLRRTSLHGTRLRAALLIDADLRDTDLRSTQLVGAQMDGADFRGAQLGGQFWDVSTWSASARGANLAGVTFAPGTNLDFLDLSDAVLTGIDFTPTVGGGIYVPGADLRGAQLTGLRLGWTQSGTRYPTRGSVFDGADLRGVDLSGTSLGGLFTGEEELAGASFVSADLAGATFAGADLTAGPCTAQAECGRGADLTGAVLVNADFLGATLRNSEVTGHGRTNATLTDAIWGNTRCPDGLIVGSSGC